MAMDRVASGPEMAEEALQNKMEMAKIADDCAESPVATLITVEEWNTARDSAVEAKETLLLQLGASWCERCPAMHEAIAEMKADFQFKWVYSDAADTELTEHFEISKLPAVVMINEGMKAPWIRQAASVEVVRGAVKLMCPGVFVTDADF